MATATEPRDRVPYDRAADVRKLPKRGLCGRAWCYQPCAWVWTDAGGSTRHECNRHAGLPDNLEDGDERVREGLRRENNGLISQRLAAIDARNPKKACQSGWAVECDADGLPPARMTWVYHAART